MNQTITWLHLSDLHAGKPNAGWDSRRVMNTLVKDLEEMERDQGLHPDFIFFTGDAAFGQYGSGPNETLPDQFTIVQQFFTSVQRAFEPEIPIENLYLVPGNHDVDRKMVGDPLTLWLDSQKDSSTINNLVEIGGLEWQRYMDRLTAYREFLKNNNFSHLLDDPDRLVYGAVRHVAGATVGIGGFNTAWSCCRDKEKGKLWMGSHWQEEQVQSKLEKTKVSIVLMHHPPSWLTEHEAMEFERDLERDFKFILHGHEHAEWVTTGSDGYTRIAAGACYESSDKKNGYNFVRLDLETGKGEVWLREYDRNGGGWGPCSVKGKTEKFGMWPLSHLSWLPSTSIPRGVIQVPDERGLIQNMFGMKRGSLSPDSILYLIGHSQLAIESPREDIAWQLVESTIDYQVPMEEKEPLLQELRTERQIAKNFLPLPKFVNGLDKWLAADRDLLFLGLPFCGKTTLLTYITFELSKRRGDDIIPIYLRLRKDLPPEEAEGAVSRLKDDLRQNQLLHQKQQIILIIDNIHTPVGLRVAHFLMKPPRQWRLWAAARSRELMDSVSAGIENSWKEENYVRDICDLVGEKEIDFVVDQVISPILTLRGEERLVQEVRQEMKAVGQVPMRYLIQVWNLIYKTRGDVETGYVSMIKEQPKGLAEIVRHVMPQNRAGIDALTITHYLKKPSWELLTHILSVVEGYGIKVAETTIDSLRKTFALLPDSEQPCRVTMYDPVREKVGESSNLPISLKEQIWLGLESFLQQENYTKEIGEPDHLVDTWIDLSDLAMNEKRYLIALGCAQRANAYAVGAKRVIALRQIVYCLYEPKPDCKKILAVYREMLEEITEPEKIADRGNTIWHLATCLCCEKSNTSRDWDEAISLYRQALNMITKPEQETERAGILHRFADCLKNKPQPNWDEALELYQQALELLTKPKQVTERAKTLRDLAHCLQDKPQPDWDKAVEHYQQALELLTKPKQVTERAKTLRDLARCMQDKPQPDWEKAINLYHQALDLFTKPEHVIDRTETLHRLAICLRNKPQPDWDEAIILYKEALNLLTGSEHITERARVMHFLANSLYKNPQPNWDEAIDLYHQALDLLTEPDQTTDRARTLRDLAACLESKPELNCEKVMACLREMTELLTESNQAAERAYPLWNLAICMSCDSNKSSQDWDKAIVFYRQALELLSESEQIQDRVNALYRFANCLYNKPQPDWEGAINLYKQALDLLKGYEQVKGRANILKDLAECLKGKPQPDWDEAIIIYKQALDLLTKPEQATDRAQTLLGLAVCLQSKPLPDWDGAISFYSQTLEFLTKPEQATSCAIVMHYLATCLREKPQPDWSGAINLYYQGLDLLTKPEQVTERVQILRGLAGCLMDKPQPDLDEAINLYHQAIDARPKSVRAYSDLADLYFFKQSRYEDAEKVYRDAIKKDPNDAHVYCQLGILLCVKNRLEEAIPVLEKSKKLLPCLAPVLCLAGIYQKLKNKTLFAKYITEARTFMQPEDWYNFACLESISGNTDIAFDYLKRAAQKAKFDRDWAWIDPDLECIRNDKRFKQIVGKSSKNESEANG